MTNVTGTVRVQNKKYPYTIIKKKNNTVYVECEAAKVAQEFLGDDIADLLVDLPNLIVAEKNHSSVSIALSAQ